VADAIFVDAAELDAPAPLAALFAGDRTAVLQVAGLAASLAYLVLLPAGPTGLILALAGVVLLAAAAGRATLAVGLMLVLPTLAGLLLRSIDLPYIGAMVCISTGLALVVFFRAGRGHHGLWGGPVAWLLVTCGALTVAYTYGPQTDYAQQKLLRSVGNIALAVAAFGVLARDPHADLRRLGLLAVATAVGGYAAAVYQWPVLAPEAIWIPCGLKAASEETDTAIATNTIASLACLGVVCLVAASPDRRSSKGRMIVGAMGMVVGMLVIYSAGQRLFLVAPLAAAATILLCKPKVRAKPLAVLVVIMVAVGVVTVVGLMAEDPRFVQALGDEGTFAERVNRSTNWDAAAERIAEEPFWGHGLGGYYINGYSRPGEGTYAHNLVLELLSETGLLGTLIILAPIVVVLVFFRRTIREARTARGGTLVPLAAFFIVYAMISHDLATSSVVFGILAVLWAFRGTREMADEHRDAVTETFTVPVAANPFGDAT
jgi:O-antigen ligase